MSAPEPSELWITGGQVVDVLAGTVRLAEVHLRGERIEAVTPPGSAPAGATVLDARGRYVAPGFMDAHLHIESSLLAPLEFARRAVEHGTTAVFVDPHEIANVQGRRGIDLFLAHAERAPLDIYLGIPSCVPATNLEDSGAEIGLADIEALIAHPRVYGLAEMMNFPGIIHGLGNAREKVARVLAHGKQVDAHAPALTGAELRLYVTNGADDGVTRISQDHECTTAAEALEKLGLGMAVALRHGSAAKDLPRVLPGVLAGHPSLERVLLCSDDLDPAELHTDGHVDRIIRAARAVLMDAGVALEPATVRAIALATEHTARHYAPFFSRHDRALPGAVAAGRAANLVLLRDLESLAVDTVLRAGQVVVRDGRLVADPAGVPDGDGSDPAPPPPVPLAVGRRFQPADFAIPAPGGRAQVETRVIGFTDGIWTEARQHTLPVVDGAVALDDHTAKLAVVERHRGSGGFSVALVERALRTGAVAGTVAHDSHNVIALGVDDAALAKAVNHLAEHGGGLVVVGDDVTFLPLDIGGLMSSAPLPEVVAGHARVREAVRRIGGDDHLLMRLSFLALPVIPALRLTNRGLVDVNAFDFVPVVL